MKGKGIKMAIKLKSKADDKSKTFIVIKGEAIAGKSTLASKLGKKVLFLNTDGNTASQGFNTVEINTVKDIYDTLTDKDIVNYDTVVIDTLDEIEKINDKDVCTAKGIQTLREANDYGATTELAFNRKFKIIDYLKQVSKHINVILIIRTASIKKTELSEASEKLEAYINGRADAVINVINKVPIIVNERAELLRWQNIKKLILNKNDNNVKGS
jgi:tRNA A37 threonylcarbamoyladenosine biosynthesis protein TsaE